MEFLHGQEERRLQREEDRRAEELEKVEARRAAEQAKEEARHQEWLALEKRKLQQESVGIVKTVNRRQTDGGRTMSWIDD